MGYKTIFRSIFFIISSLFSLGVILKIILLSPYILPAGDDYFGAMHLAKNGFWKENLFIYQTWDARYTATFLSTGFFALGGFKYYGLGALFLIAATLASSYFLLTRLVPKEYSRVRLLGFVFIFWVFYWLIAKPDATGNADFVFVGQFLYNAGSYCYQTSIIFLMLILASSIDFHRAESQKSQVICGVMILIEAFFLIGTNEGTAVMMILISLYGLYQGWNNAGKIKNRHLNLWIALCFFLIASLIFLTYASGDQQRMMYYDMMSDIYSLDHDWVFSMEIATSQSLFLVLFFLLNPVTWFLSWLLYPELKALMVRRQSYLPEQDFWVILLGLIWVGFFTVAWSMGCVAPPRYYGVMAILGFLGSLSFWVLCAEKIKSKILIFLGPWMAGIGLVLMLIFYAVLLPVLPAINLALEKGALFKKSYEHIVDRMIQSKKDQAQELVLTKTEFLPNVPLLDYFISAPAYRFATQNTENQKTQLLAEDIAYYYGIEKVILK